MVAGFVHGNWISQLVWRCSRYQLILFITAGLTDHKRNFFSRHILANMEVCESVKAVFRY